MLIKLAQQQTVKDICSRGVNLRVWQTDQVYERPTQKSKQMTTGQQTQSPLHLRNSQQNNVEERKYGKLLRSESKIYLSFYQALNLIQTRCIQQKNFGICQSSERHYLVDD